MERTTRRIFWWSQLGEGRPGSTAPWRGGGGVLRELTEKEHEREMGNGGAREDWRSRWLGFGCALEEDLRERGSR
jgi:hypothetical protein